MAGSNGPRKLLYTVGGLLLGGLIGTIAVPVITFVIGPLGGAVALAVPLIGSLIGAAKGWSKAASEPVSHTTMAKVSTTVSHSKAEEPSTELTREQALSQLEQQHAQFEHAPETQPSQEKELAFTEEPKKPSFVPGPRPSYADAVQAERSEPQEMWR